MSDLLATSKLQFFCVKHIAQDLNVSCETIYHRIDSGSLKAHKTGNEWRINRNDYEDFITNAKANSK